MTTLSPALTSTGPSCGTLVTADGRTLPLVRTRLAVRAAGGFAQVRLVQTFANPHAEPLHVAYQLPLPADAAVGGFEFRLGTKRVVGEIDRRQSARERFEQAIASGRTAALLEQDRSSLFRQELGNLPPGATVEATVDVDQPLAWVDGAWQWRFPTTVAPRYLGAEGRVADAGRQAVAVVDPAVPSVPPRLELELVIADALATGAAPRSASHVVHALPVEGGTQVAFAAAGGAVAMDRDVVVDWPVARPAVGVALQTLRPDGGALAGQAFGLLTLVPPAAPAHAPRLARDLIVLLDVSGSMHGAPLAQARAVTGALVESLDAEDRLELIAFASRPEPWRRGPCAATPADKAAALRWLDGLRAGGGTEMHGAILAALAATRAGAQRQVVIVTDGLIGFEQEIVAAIRSGLPAHSRVHVVGVGSATNRTLTRGASRAGRGVEVLIGVDEEPAAAARLLVAHTARPLVSELSLDGDLVLDRAPRALPDLFGGAPARLWLRLNPAGGTLVVRGHGAAGPFVQRLDVAAPSPGGDAALARGYGREAVEDLEVELAAGGPRDVLDRRIEALGLAHRIGTRLTSWVAIADEPTVDPQAPQRREVVPHELPHGMAIEQLGLRAAPAMAFGAADDTALLSLPARELAPEAQRSLPAPAQPRASAPPAKSRQSFLGRLFGGGRDQVAPGAGRPAEPAAAGQAVHATLRLRTTAQWLLELHGFTTWNAPVRAVVVFADGSEREFAVDAAHTTADASLSAGAVVRLALVVPAGGDPQAGTPVRLRFAVAGATFDMPIA